MMNNALIKVCGMRDGENIREVEALGIDLMGFIFWPKSSRCVSEIPKYMPTHCKRVGVFVDEDIEQVKHIVNDYALDIIQLHGSESPDYARQLRSVCDDGISIIKAINIATADDFKATKPFEGIVDYLLFDTKAQLPGGNGKKFDWSILEAYNGNTPFLLSGGIGPDDGERVKVFLTSHLNSRCIGIDLNSRFELAPGLKDIFKLREFLASLLN